MNEQTEQKPEEPTAGWYPDPVGSPQQRWWDGVGWTETLHQTRTPAAQQHNSVYNVFIWVIVFAPLITTLLLLFWDPTKYLNNPRQIFIFDPLYFVLNLINFLLYAGTALLAYFDSEKLTHDGIERPFHWAWVFLGGTVYVVGRTVVLHRQGKHAMAVIWSMIAVHLFTFTVFALKIFVFFVGLMTSVSRLSQ